MKTRKEILLETAGAYTSETRSVAENRADGCKYLGPDGRRCAFSRCCKDDEETAKILKDCEGMPASGLFYAHGDKLLKPEYQGNSIEFWSHVQSLHDCSYNWDENGLSEMGGNNWPFYLENLAGNNKFKLN